MFRLLLSLVVVLALSAGPGMAGGVELVVESAQIKETKANGKAWDAGNGLPDPYVLVRVQPSEKKASKEVGRTSVQKDTLNPRWNKKVCPLSLGDVVTVEVWDKDAAVDDLIGRDKYTVTETLIKQRVLRLSFGQVKQLQLSLRSLDDTVVNRRGSPEPPSDPKEELAPRLRLLAQLGHPVMIQCGAFSPDGEQVLTGGFDKTARLWDTQSGKVLRTLTGHSGPLESVTFSPDGKKVLTGSWDKTARLWDAQTGKEIRTFTGHDGWVLAITLSTSGKWVLTGSGDGTARLWDIQTGKEIRVFTGHKDRVLSVAFSPDGKQVLTGSADKTARLWDTQSGKELRTFRGHGRWVRFVAFSPDSKSVLIGSADKKTAGLWDAQTGKEILAAKEYRSFTGHAGPCDFEAFSRDGKRVLTGIGDETARLWDAESGKELRAFTGAASWVEGVAFAPSGKLVLTGGGDNTAQLWDIQNGKKLRDLVGHSYAIMAVTFSPDGKQVLTGSADKTARLWDTQNGREIRTFKGHANLVPSVAFSPDGKHVLTGSWDNTARLWDAQSGKTIHTFKGHAEPIQSVAFSPDGKQVLTASWDNTARLWDAESGKTVHTFKGHSSRTFKGHPEAVLSVAFSPDAKQVLTGGADNTARLWNAQTGEELRLFIGHARGVSSVAFSPDGKQVLTGSADFTAQLWDAQSGKKLRTFTGHDDRVRSVAFSPDGKQILTGSSDGTSRIWEARTGRELCKLISFRGGTWAVVDPEGRFDASNGGDVEGLHWVVGNEPISLIQLKVRYYEPGLLAKILDFNKEPLSQVEAFAAPKLFPAVQLAAPTPDKPRLGVTLTNRGGGIGRVVVKINGKELTPDARPRGADPDAKTMHAEVSLADDPRLKPGVENTIEVQAFNAEGYLRSRGMIVSYVHRGKASETPPEVWAVVVGVSKFHNAALELRYAGKDAEDFAQALEIAATRLFGKEHLHLTLLTSSQTDAERQPTRANLVRALEAVHKAKPGDILVLYLAGHGVNFGGQDGDFYYLTADARGADLTDPEVRKQTALSSRELTELIKKVPVQRQVLVLDTCAAARAVERLTDKRAVPSSQVRALERVKDRTGLFILAGCAADAVSYEATRYAQGLLTYSLLLGMRGAALKEDQQVDVGRLFDFAADRVPELARDIGGIQRPVIASPRGASFPIGLVTTDDRARIPLRTPRPLVLRTLFQDEEEFTDGLGLGRLIDERLRERSTRGTDGRLVFVDARELPGAYNLAGRYRIEGDKVRVTVRLARGKGKGIRFLVEGEKGRPDELAGRIVAEVEKRLGKRDDS
jgi:WD40 repeat protein